MTRAGLLASDGAGMQWLCHLLHGDPLPFHTEGGGAEAWGRGRVRQGPPSPIHDSQKGGPQPVHQGAQSQPVSPGGRQISDMDTWVPSRLLLAPAQQLLLGARRP